MTPVLGGRIKSSGKTLRDSVPKMYAKAGSFTSVIAVMPTTTNTQPPHVSDCFQLRMPPSKLEISSVASLALGS